MEARDILFFDTMLTPKIITVVYWIVLVSAVVTGVGVMFSTSFWGGLGAMVAVIVGTRIVCELMVVAFKANEALQEIRNK
ncbi:MAG: DUF4282 domain-containing protein [Gammaproteobacteria bacterium]|jgi:hypothetical protein|nr:DUF4282 domain-containing protein [Gammaproteobacteria bacterium]MDP6615935.1 DUF4282 domain-containing protein [Gammaproteobacteria bacterium]MDP6695026.1 DUF4282 domain-containing protein [Gammaproteobacteria bacterium]MDP7042204.1 DUF4282 domain-containing protein [Gammaproteobacteria bacterium]